MSAIKFLSTCKFHTGKLISPIITSTTMVFFYSKLPMKVRIEAEMTIFAFGYLIIPAFRSLVL